MILAQNHFQTMLLLIVSALCWGLWAGVYRRGKLRWEFFYYDVALAAGIVAVICAMTLGSLGYDGFSLMDDISHAYKRQLLFAFGAGIIFNLSNMLMMGAIALAGLSIAVPVGMGLSTIGALGITVLLSQFGNPALKFPATACLLLGCLLPAVAYMLMISGRQDLLLKEGKVKTANLPGYSQGRILSTDAPSVTKGLLLSFAAAALMWIAYPLLNRARAGETGLGPYSCLLLFMAGLAGSTFVFNLFFTNLPIEGEPLEILDYLGQPFSRHLPGLFAGAILCAGVMCELVAEGGAAEAQVGTVMTYAIKQGAILLAAFWGIWVWKDFRDANPRVRGLAVVFTAFLALGVALMVLAAMSGKA